MVDSQKAESWPTSAKGYALDSVVGQGSFGLVWRANCSIGVHKDQWVAIKIIDMGQFEDSSIQDIRKEIAIMSASKHKNIVSEHIAFVDGNHLWLVMPILDAGSTHDILKTTMKDGIQDEATIATILKETLEGLAYFHENGQIHRDIKAGNILMDMQGRVFLSDFGVSASLKKGQKRGTFVGSPCWMAPEVMNQTGHDFLADIWSVGITAIELALGDAPHTNMTAMKVIMVILNGEPPKLPEEGPWSSEFRHFVSSCLKKEASKRPNVQELFAMNKAFFAKAKDANYLKVSFLKNLPALKDRLDPALQTKGVAFLNINQNKKCKPKKTKWNFSSGDQKDTVDQESVAKPKKVPGACDVLQVGKPNEDDDLFDDLDEGDF